MLVCYIGINLKCICALFIQEYLPWKYIIKLLQLKTWHDLDCIQWYDLEGIQWHDLEGIQWYDLERNVWHDSEGIH